MTTTHLPQDASVLMTADGSIDLALNRPGHGSRVRLRRAWWGPDDDELVVGGLLEEFVADNRDWHVLHSVYVDALGADIDHLLLGPAGAVVVRDAYVPDMRVWAGGESFVAEGRRMDHLRQTRTQERAVHRILGEALGFAVPVTGLVVPVGARDIVVGLPTPTLAVVAPRHITHWLGCTPHRWAPRHSAGAYEVARRASTWA